MNIENATTYDESKINNYIEHHPVLYRNYIQGANIYFLKILFYNLLNI